MDTTDTLLTQLGFPADERGPAARLLAERLAAGGVDRVHASWTGGTWEERAREMLAIDWEIEHGGAYEVRCIDGLGGWRYDFIADRRRYRIRWRSLPAWLGDHGRRWRAAFNRWRAGPNPYRT